ncbi:hypothetical protein PAEPH01_0528 [Pancytospora epiphaga]|nr:hypothetical protein PAEPH01_0528 [Pancytospora epiphaga]
MNISIKYSYNPEYTPTTPMEYNNVEIELIDDSSNVYQPFSFEDKTMYVDTLKRAEVTGIEKLPCKWRNVYRVKLQRNGEFTPGDTVGLIVPNSDALVDRLMSLCGIRDAFCRICRTGRSSFVYEGRIRDFFKYKCDLKGIPRRIYLLNLAKSSPLRKHIEYICSPEGANDYINLGVNWHSIVDIIEYFKCKVECEDLIRNCEIIKPRHYTLINSKGDDYEILLGEITRREGAAIKYGHVSEFINTRYNETVKCNRNIGVAKAEENYSLAFIETTFRKNILIGNIDTDCLICICTGTGIALFLALYRERRANQRIILIYGYRDDEDDISKLYDLDCQIIKAKSSDGNRVTQYCKTVEPYKNYCRIVICGCTGMQRTVFLELRRLYPEIVQEKRIHLDNWQ